MDDECEVVYVAGLGKMLGRTEASVREGIRRGVDWLPKGFKMGASLPPHQGRHLSKTAKVQKSKKGHH